MSSPELFEDYLSDDSSENEVVNSDEYDSDDDVVYSSDDYAKSYSGENGGLILKTINLKPNGDGWYSDEVFVAPSSVDESSVCYLKDSDDDHNCNDEVSPGIHFNNLNDESLSINSAVLSEAIFSSPGSDIIELGTEVIKTKITDKGSHSSIFDKSNIDDVSPLPLKERLLSANANSKIKHFPNEEWPRTPTSWRQNNPQLSDDLSTSSDSSDSDIFVSPKSTSRVKSVQPKRKLIKSSSHSVYPQTEKKQPSKSNQNASDEAFLKSLDDPSIYDKNFSRHREALTKQLFSIFNETVFDGLFDDQYPLTWNPRLTRTAGRMFHSRNRENTKTRIELSPKVIDRACRLRDTLIHEMCHAVCWVRFRASGHGSEWKLLAKKANRKYACLPIIERCHSYAIHCKYNYSCTKCDYRIGRHSRSVDISVSRCPTCFGELVLEGSSTTRTPAFALFVKNNYNKYKKPGSRAADVMKLLGEKYKSMSLKDDPD